MFGSFFLELPGEEVEAISSVSGIAWGRGSKRCRRITPEPFDRVERCEEPHMKQSRSQRTVLAAGLSIFAVFATPLLSQEKGGGDETGSYELVPNWPENPCGAGFQVGSTAGIFAESPDRVLIFQRGCLPELKDRTFGQPQSLVPSRNASGYD